MAFQITGKIEDIGVTIPITTKSGQIIYRRELVLDCTRYNPETGEQWENHPKFEFAGNNCRILDQFQKDQRVTVDFSLKGAKYPDPQTGEIKYFTSINAFRVTLAEQQAQNQHQPTTAPTNQQPSMQHQSARQAHENGISVPNDDLPF